MLKLNHVETLFTFPISVSLFLSFPHVVPHFAPPLSLSLSLSYTHSLSIGSILYSLFISLFDALFCAHLKIRSTNSFIIFDFGKNLFKITSSTPFLAKRRIITWSMGHWVCNLLAIRFEFINNDVFLFSKNGYDDDDDADDEEEDREEEKIRKTNSSLFLVLRLIVLHFQFLSSPSLHLFYFYFSPSLTRSMLYHF